MRGEDCFAFYPCELWYPLANEVAMLVALSKVSKSRTRPVYVFESYLFRLSDGIEDSVARVPAIRVVAKIPIH